MTGKLTTDAEAELAEEVYTYRSVSKAAVACLIFGMISQLAWFAWPMTVLGLAGLILGVIALVNFRRYPDELTGQIPATIGLVLCGAVFIFGNAMHTYIYATEVPEGYERITFSELQPTNDRPDLPMSPEALELNGKKVFIKGYVFPGAQKNNLKHFVMVRDFGSCCFGTEPKPTHMMEVTLTDPHRVNYSTRLRKFGGTLKVHERGKFVGERGVYFELEADYVQ